MPQFNLFTNPSAMAPLHIPQTQAAIRKLHFDESM
jgi:hypothetical protein